VRQTQSRADYAAMLEQLDSAIGRVLDSLEANGLADHTIVVFMSDNGGLATAEGNPTSNLPYRGGKGWPYEGGVLGPWIVRAPGVTTAGATCDTPVISTDYYPTLLELCGLPLMPEQHKDGVSIVPLLKGGAIPARPLFWHYPHYGNQGGSPFGMIREGDLKLIEWYENGSLEMYNVRQDVSEAKNLATENGAKAKELQAKLAEWRKSVNAVMPTPNPKGDDDARKFKQKLTQAAAKLGS
jgi:arylsulfatase A-like enzyme